VSPVSPALITAFRSQAHSLQASIACPLYGKAIHDGTKEEPMAKSSSSSPREQVRPIVPKLIDLTEKVLFGDVWERPGLSKRDRSLITVAALTALCRPEQLRVHIERALGNGVTKDEISELITHLAFYSGWPTAMTAAFVAKGIFEEQQ
jgi:4-carboxymuconolactone decarboxylase